MIITKKSEVKERLNQCFSSYKEPDLEQFVVTLHKKILQHKIKFPLLEFCGLECFLFFKTTQHINLCNKIAALKTEGGNVMIGIILQKRINDFFYESLEKAAEYISIYNQWQACDIIGERVYGYALLTQPKQTFPELQKLAGHSNYWVARSLGAGFHYAIKKGLSLPYVKLVFEQLITMANTNQKEIKQGIGWAAKTTARFYPGLVRPYLPQIEQNTDIGKWFITKINIGLSRAAYAKRN